MLKWEESNNFKIGDLLSAYTDVSFVNKDGKIIKADELSFLGAGQNSAVWKYIDDNTPNALKIFFDDAYQWSLSYNCFQKMKNLPLKRTLKAKDTFYRWTESSQVCEEFDAYNMDYVEETKKHSLLDMPTSIFLENFRLLEEDSEILAENKIRTDDVKIENSIINQYYELFFSDVDLYEVDYSKSKYSILRNNKKDIYWFIVKYLRKELENLEMQKVLKSEEYCIALEEIYDGILEKTSKTKIHKYLEKLFYNYECPKEYFLSLKK